ENGSKYQSENAHPQAISRIVNPAGASEHESYFLLDKVTHGGIQYWCPFDLLGRVLSIISPAPQGATNYNFYLPLTLMYANWCRKTAPFSPFAYSCVWAEENGKQSRFHLGASLGGYRLPKPRSGLWVKILQQARFDILHDQRLNTMGITKAHSSTLKGRKTRTIPYGNCAETYPLVHLLRNRNPREEIYGIAVMPPKQPIYGYSHQQALGTLARPCTNCQEVIGVWGGKVENFITDEMPEHGTSAAVRSPTSRDPEPGASGSGIALPIRRKRPSPDNDTAGSTPKG
ncbi:unnamed protein product, partial [Penicillium nalgiovense]